MIIVAGIICTATNNITVPIILAAISGGFVTSAGNIINDVLDIEIDKINRPERPLPKGDISSSTAVLTYILFSFSAIIIAIQINLSALIIVLFTTGILILYSYKFKYYPLFGNAVVAFFTGLAFIYGGIAANNWYLAIIPASFAFFINFIREIIKDMEDVKGDKKANVITYPVKFGFTYSKRVALILTLLLIALTTVPFIFHIYNIEYFIVVMGVVNVILIYFLVQLFKNHSKENLKRLSNLLKLNMVFGLIAIYIGI